MTDVVANYVALNEALRRGDAGATRSFLKDGLPRAGDCTCSTDLADTLGAIRRGGADAFYSGTIAERIVATLQRGGSAMTLEDLASHRTEAALPLRLAWNGGELLTHPPNSQGACLLLGAGMLAGDGRADEPAWHHLGVEAMKRAIAIRDATFRDPAFGPTGIEQELTVER